MDQRHNSKGTQANLFRVYTVYLVYCPTLPNPNKTKGNDITKY